MNILLLGEGNAETRDCWSGIGKSVVDHLRAAGHAVRVGDADLYGPKRWLAAALTVAPHRPRWAARYHLSGMSFALRSSQARHAIQRLAGPGPGCDVILQLGATFHPGRRQRVPYALYCDSNIRMAEHGREYGYSDASFLREPELQAVRRREATVYAGARAIFTISERLRRSFIEDFGLAPERVHAVHAGPNLDPRWWSDGTPHRAPNGSILFVGRQFERKGGDVLLSAFAEVRRAIPDATLEIVGPAPRTAQPGVRWLGSLRPEVPAEVAELVAAYRRAGVFCLPTRYEPFGIVYLEAMHFGLPCVGTATGAVPEMITEGKTGYTVPVGDAAALAARLTALLRDPETAAALGAAGRARAREHFTWPAVVHRIAGTLDAVRGVGAGG